MSERTNKLVEKLAQDFTNYRSKNYTGKKRDDAAFEFFLGAACVLEGVDEEGYNHILGIAAVLISTFGFSEVERIAHHGIKLD